MVCDHHVGLYWQRIRNGIWTHFPLWAEKVKSGFLPTALASLVALYGMYAFSIRDMSYVLTIQSASSGWIAADTPTLPFGQSITERKESLPCFGTEDIH